MPHFMGEKSEGQTSTIHPDQWGQLIALLVPMAELAKAGLAEMAGAKARFEAVSAPQESDAPAPAAPPAGGE